MSDHIPKKKKNSPPISKWNFIAHWVFGQVVITLLIGAVVFLIANSPLVGNILLGLVILFIAIACLIVGIAFVQKQAIHTHKGIELHNWIAVTVIGVAASIIWFLFEPTDILFPRGSSSVDIKLFIAFAPIVLILMIAQSYILQQHVKRAWVYGLVGSVSGYALVHFIIAFIANNDGIFILILAAAIYLFATAYTIHWLFDE